MARRVVHKTQNDPSGSWGHRHRRCTDSASPPQAQLQRPHGAGARCLGGVLHTFCRASPSNGTDLGQHYAHFFWELPMAKLCPFFCWELLMAKLCPFPFESCLWPNYALFLRAAYGQIMPISFWELPMAKLCHIFWELPHGACSGRKYPRLSPGRRGTSKR